MKGVILYLNNIGNAIDSSYAQFMLTEKTLEKLRILAESAKYDDGSAKSEKTKVLKVDGKWKMDAEE